MGLELMTIKTWTEIKSPMLTQLNHPGTPPLNFIE